MSLRTGRLEDVLGFAEETVGGVHGRLRVQRTRRVSVAAPPLPALILLSLWLPAAALLAFLGKGGSAALVAGRPVSPTATRDVIRGWIPAAAPGSACTAAPSRVTLEIAGSILLSLVLMWLWCTIRFCSSFAGWSNVAFSRSSPRRKNLVLLAGVHWGTVK